MERQRRRSARFGERSQPSKTAWTRRYHGCDPREKASGRRVVMTMDDGSVRGDEIAYEI
jgi:hypothetical protein